MEQTLDFNFDPITEQMGYCFELLKETWEKAKVLDNPMYYSFIAMLVEERCKVEHEDVVKKFAELSKTAQDIKDMLGEY